MNRTLSTHEAERLEAALVRAHGEAKLPSVAIDQLVLELPVGVEIDDDVAERIADTLVRQMKKGAANP